MTCKVKHDGESRTIDQAVMFNIFDWYKTVLDHVQKCSMCIPECILRKYIDARKRKNLASSLVFIRLVFKYQKMAELKNKPIPNYLIKEIMQNIKNMGILSDVCDECDDYLSHKDVVNILVCSSTTKNLQTNKHYRTNIESNFPRSKASLLYKVMDDVGLESIMDLKNEELEKICSVYLIHNS